MIPATTITDSPQAKRYTSAASWLGLPLLSVAFGPDPVRGEKSGRARGVVAVGDTATGIVAVGGIARGVVAVGGVSVGVVSVGGLTVGALASGGLALGGWADGGLALGMVATGGLAVGITKALGGLAVGIKDYFGVEDSPGHAEIWCRYVSASSRAVASLSSTSLSLNSQPSP